MKKKHFIWIIVLLTVINLSAIGTILYHIRFQDEEKDDPSVYFETPGNTRRPGGRMGRFLMEELNLSPEQHQEFRMLRRNFHMQARELTMEMQVKRNDMITELAKADPDTLKLHDIADEIGSLHAQLKDLTIEYYLGMKEISSPEQQKKLFRIFDVIINEDNEMPMHGRRRNIN